MYGVRCGNNDNAEDFYKTLGEVSGGAYLKLSNIKEMEKLIKGLCYRQATDFIAASSSSSMANVEQETNQGEPLSNHQHLEIIHNAIHDSNVVRIKIRLDIGRSLTFCIRK